jgi:hypothetical protein
LAKLTPREIPEVVEEVEVVVETETKEKEKDKKKPRARAKKAIVVEEEIVNEEVAKAKEEK